jgi:hypothetical protein
LKGDSGAVMERVAVTRMPAYAIMVHFYYGEDIAQGLNGD